MRLKWPEQENVTGKRHSLRASVNGKPALVVTDSLVTTHTPQIQQLPFILCIANWPYA